MLVQRCRRSLLLLGLSLTLSSLSFGQSHRIREHEVAREETLYSIARRYNVDLEKLLELNPWARKQIKVGDKLLIPSEAVRTKVTTASGVYGKHTVQAGETLYRISKNYGIELEDLLRANPGVTSANVKVGQELNIPRSHSEGTAVPVPATPVPAPKAAETPSIELPTAPIAKAQVRVALLLPMNHGRRYVEFYEGFLLGMYELKKTGVSIQLTTLDTPSDESLQRYIAEGKLADKDLVFGGVNDKQIAAIAAAQGYRYYVVPFSRVDGLELGAGSSAILVNAHPEYLIDRVIPSFLQRYKGREVVFVQRSGDSEDLFAQELRKALRSAKLPHRDFVLGSEGKLSPNAVLVPVGADRSLAQASLNYLTTQGTGATIFGYPQWQSYGASFLKALGRYGGTIYSSFFFDPMSSGGRDFLTQYNHWYSHKLDNTYPKYSVLGYDLARYFIRAYALYGASFVRHQSSIPSDGLQIDLSPRETFSEGEGAERRSLYTNTRCYLVTFRSSGAVYRETI